MPLQRPGLGKRASGRSQGAVTGSVTSTLSGSIVVVTGAAGQIGRALMQRLQAAGATAVGLDLAAACPVGDQRYVPCDITDETSVRESIAQITEGYARIDVLIHCAGLSAIGAFEDHSLAVHRNVMEVTHFGAVAVTLAALPALRASKGRIVVVGSVAGFAPVLGRPPYVAAKHAVTGLFTALRPELEPASIGITLVHPTFVTGGMAEASARSEGRTRAVTGEEITPDRVAKEIVAGVEKRRDLVLVGKTARRAWLVNRLAPRTYARLMARRLRAD